MGWIRITPVSPTASLPDWAEELNREADRLDPLTRNNHTQDQREREEDWTIDPRKVSEP